jgi:ribonuclease HI
MDRFCTIGASVRTGGGDRGGESSRVATPPASPPPQLLQRPAQEVPRAGGPGPRPLRVFTDGACTHNGSKKAKGGYAVYWPDEDDPDLNEAAPLPPQPPPTNNRAELLGVIRALELADGPMLDPLRLRPVVVYTDSQLLISSATAWLPGWKRAGWRRADGKPVANPDLLQRLDALLRGRAGAGVRFVHVRAHTGRDDWESRGNAMADGMARAACG